MTTMQIVITAAFVLLVVYLGVRLATAAFYKSKQDYENRRKTNG